METGDAGSLCGSSKTGVIAKRTVVIGNSEKVFSSSLEKRESFNWFIKIKGALSCLTKHT